MLRMRVILMAITVGLGYIQYLLPQYGLPFEIGYPGILLHLALDILMISAACIFLFSFFKVDITPDGRVCYKPNNPYWKIMVYLKIFDSSVSLCRAYWITVGLVTVMAIILAMCAVLLAIISGLSYTAYDAAFNQNMNSAAALGYFGLIIALTSALVYLTKFLGWLEEKMSWFEYVNTALIIIVLCAVTVALPIFTIAVKDEIGYGEAALVYCKWIGISALGVGGAILLIWGAFKYLPVLKNTWMGYIFRSIKKEFCPQLVACPIGDNAVN